MLIKIFVLLICYIIGNFSPSYWLTRVVKKVDIRDVGSGNAGSTNALRIMGKRAGAAVFAIDFLKGALCSFIGLKVGGYDFGYLCAMMVVLGHIFPAFMGFKGGKGVATSIGSVMVLQPMYVIIGLIIALIFVAKTRYVSLGSIMGVLSFVIIMFFTGHRGLDMGISTGMLLIVVYTHRANVMRLLNGTESKLGEKTKQ